MGGSVGGRIAIERGAAYWASERTGSAAGWILAAVILVPTLGFGLREGWELLTRERPDPHVAAILDRAAERGVFAVDGVSRAENMRPRELLEGDYVLTTTARTTGARPDLAALLPSGRDCATMARELARLNRSIGFCERR